MRYLVGNVAPGVLEAGFYLGFGFVLDGSITGGAPTFALSMVSTVVFGLLGLVALVGGGGRLPHDQGMPPPAAPAAPAPGAARGRSR